MPATVEKRRKVSVCLPTSERNFARVHCETSRVSVKVPYAAGAAGVHDPLRDALAVEVGELLQQRLVLDENRTADASGLAVLVVGDRRAGLRGERSLRHVRLLRHVLHFGDR